MRESRRMKFWSLPRYSAISVLLMSLRHVIARRSCARRSPSLDAKTPKTSPRTRCCSRLKRFRRSMNPEVRGVAFGHHATSGVSIQQTRAFYQAGRVDLDEFLIEQVQALAQPLVRSPEGGDELRLALENVPADYALVLRLRFFDEMPLKRISAFLGAPLSTVKWRIHRGKQLLREQVEL